MRKFVAVFLAWTLLIISSAPLSVEAASCAMPEHDMVSEQSMADGHAHHVNHDESATADSGHEHHMALMNDWQKDRIECGCGCHRSVDSLPHLLAPHMIDSASFHAGNASSMVSIKPVTLLVMAAVQVPLPPPQLA
ncbi:hypothetical protein MMIC_P2295 [Mariprofundus micogutta]|uniref:Cobalt-zinc-cadmium resistance protein CzcI n=1 Tax=Mariprofundus micogutta TaxID=1921010 RepID=A0A1L8CQW5_9PROT|nr:hypothetical protein [Mariprofundus micogutta]GAV21312.1 hypothetical protein MMIC_P2295 [Mariprofundus micogutta]